MVYERCLIGRDQLQVRPHEPPVSSRDQDVDHLLRVGFDVERPGELRQLSGTAEIATDARIGVLVQELDGIEAELTPPHRHQPIADEREQVLAVGVVLVAE